MKKIAKPLNTRSLVRIIMEMLGVGSVIISFFAVSFAILNRTNGSLRISGEKRRYLIYVPKSLDNSRPVPLVLTIHGFAEWPAHVRDVTGWNKLADKYGFIVVYPSGTKFPKRWAAFNEKTPEDGQTRDVQFISALISKLKADYNIDPKRIYVNGFSNGGGMSFLCACELSDRVAAVGAVSGAYLFDVQNCNATRPVPMIVFHGTADPIVPFNGGTSHSFDLPFPAIPQWVEAYAHHNGCTGKAETTRVTPEVTLTRYSAIQLGAEVAFYTLAGQGHDWAGGKALPVWLAGTHTDAVNTTELIWAFFQEHPLA
jgi:polyhydroxybutyrate depolymerase